MEMFFKKGIFILIFLNVFHIQAQNDYNKLDDKGNKNGLWKGIYKDTKALSTTEKKLEFLLFLTIKRQKLLSPQGNSVQKTMPLTRFFMTNLRIK
jgi:hypothetical protein